MVFREQALLLWSGLPRRVSLQSFCLQKRRPLPFVSQKASSAQQGRDLYARQRSLIDRNVVSFSKGKSARPEDNALFSLWLFPFSQLARAAWSPGFRPRPRNCF